MVKRLHLGRASEAGVLAASLAADGFEGPRTVLEGEFGFLKVFCTKWDEAELTRGLGEEFLVSTTVLKRYPCHATAHAAVRAVRDLQAEHGFSGPEVEAITVTGTERMVERHNILEPADLMLAQYSIPFCVALALHREARDPESFDETALRDPQIRALCRRVRLVPEPGAAHGGMASTVTIALADGRRFEGRAENGMLEPGELDDKFLRLTRSALGEPGAAALFERLQRLEDEEDLGLARRSAVARHAKSLICASDAVVRFGNSSSSRAGHRDQKALKAALDVRSTCDRIGRDVAVFRTLLSGKLGTVVENYQLLRRESRLGVYSPVVVRKLDLVCHRGSILRRRCRLDPGSTPSRGDRLSKQSHQATQWSARCGLQPRAG